MKYILFSIAAVITFTLGACDKESSGTDYDLSDTLQPYIIIGKTAIKTKPDSIATIRFTMRTGLSKEVTVNYSVTGSVELGNQTVVMNRYTTTKDVVIDIPGGTVAPSTTVVTLLGATKSDGTPLTIGRYGVASGEKVNINIAAP
ncbi:MAG: hypothetical protein J7497_07015 [Chitinophagaceae bacterium]|nr:hypothetical protein [Chitinophagaceae bacterium]